ncbi:VOC family protein [Cocleimonas flava]|uniref:Glyoxalase/bleomycin resistance protein/dioxygenase superfamily protein n=1 Tax=Cocleimonas flava TaxID=634765 RepID=A0A4R1F0D2_9GAMM|nr:VOC family protein [Cocleimonas flava]TCJ84958.1 glyoxalase/bleomycin resistance protein/dioxygenase superfamily protein [Cocleimonas flava]
MQIEKLDHVNIRTTQLDNMINWYSHVLGMKTGDRPNFPFPGAWLYSNDTVMVHLIGIDGPEGIGSEAYLKLEHFAFSASGLNEFEARLNELKEEYRRVDLSAVNLVQINIWDPDGNHIHVDFAADE